MQLQARLDAGLEELERMSNTFNQDQLLPSEITNLLCALDKQPETQRSTLKLASIAYLAGYVIRVMEENKFCQLCLENVSQADSDSPLVGLIKLLNRGDLRYPRQSFIMLIATVTTFVERAVPYLRESPGIYQIIESHLFPRIAACPYIQCGLNDEHSNQIAELICKKVVPLMVTNITKTISARFERVKELVTKPLSRKVHKV